MAREEAWGIWRKAFQAEKVACAEAEVQPVFVFEQQQADQLDEERREKGDSRMGDEVKERTLRAGGAVGARMAITAPLPLLRKSCKNKMTGNLSTMFSDIADLRYDPSS